MDKNGEKPIVIVTLLNSMVKAKSLVTQISEALSPFCKVAIFDRDNEVILIQDSDITIT